MAVGCGGQSLYRLSCSYRRAIPVRSAYPEGGYKVETSPFSPDAAEIVVSETVKLLEALT